LLRICGVHRSVRARFLGVWAGGRVVVAFVRVPFSTAVQILIKTIRGATYMRKPIKCTVYACWAIVRRKESAPPEMRRGTYTDSERGPCIFFLASKLIFVTNAAENCRELFRLPPSSDRYRCAGGGQPSETRRCECVRLSKRVTSPLMRIPIVLLPSIHFSHV
jgi:hypothetical protein